MRLRTKTSAPDARTLPPLGRVWVSCLLLILLSPWSISAAERQTKELEDVTDAEKVKWARATRVLITDAIKAAADRTSGQVIEAALHSISGRLLYEIEVVTKDGTVVELFVDPQTGKLVDMGEGR
jgi:uncharacterized membrane protein YkoI